MPRTYQKRPPKTELVEALHKAAGIITAVAARYGVHRTSVYNWIKAYGIQEEVQQAKRVMIDLAENNLLQRLREGDWRATEFVLRTMGGYSERTQVQSQGEMTVRVVYETAPLPEDDGLDSDTPA